MKTATGTSSVTVLTQNVSFMVIKSDVMDVGDAHPTNEQGEGKTSTNAKNVSLTKRPKRIRLMPDFV